MECRLQKSTESWKCQVFLRIETDGMGNRVSDVHEEKFGPLLTDKSKLEDMLRRAQLAILNPRVPHQSFEDFDLNSLLPNRPPIGDERPLQFSSNIVALDLYVLPLFSHYVVCFRDYCELTFACIDSSGQDLTDLSFIDLPGVSPDFRPLSLTLHWG